jgi:hypothetical protein
MKDKKENKKDFHTVQVNLKTLKIVLFILLNADNQQVNG